MSRTLRIATILCLVLGSTAYAGHGRGRGGGHGPSRPGGVVVRDHRAGGPSRPAPVVVRDHRHGGRGGARVAHVRVNNGRYMFPGGVVRVYKRPVMHRHYYDVHVRPPVIVESYEPVSGYVWVGGQWAWGGGEWVWQPGYWAVTEQPMAEPVISGGVSVSAGISIH